MRSAYNQLSLEQKYSRENATKILRKEFNKSSDLLELIELCKNLILKWSAEDHYTSKKEMLAIFLEEDINIHEMIMDILITIVLMGKSVQITALISKCIKYLPWNRTDYAQHLLLKRCGEIIYKMAEADIIDIVAPSLSEDGVIRIVHDWILDEETIEKLLLHKFLPPMVCRPKTVNEINQSPYLTAKGKVMSKWWNQSKGRDLRYDFLNKRNKTAFALDIDYLKVVPDIADFSTKDGETTKEDLESKKQLWEQYQLDTNKIAVDLINTYGNKLYFNHFYDNRLRFYTQGYHINYMGNSHRKAMIDFYENQIVELGEYAYLASKATRESKNETTAVAVDAEQDMELDI